MRKMSNILVYVAGPYTKGDPEENTLEAIRIGDILFSHGFVPFIPHLTHYWHDKFPHDYFEWIAYDLKWLKKCHCMFRMQGSSPGADMEECVAMMLGLPVFDKLEEMEKHYGLVPEIAL